MKDSNFVVAALLGAVLFAVGGVSPQVVDALSDEEDLFSLFSVDIVQCKDICNDARDKCLNICAQKNRKTQKKRKACRARCFNVAYNCKYRCFCQRCQNQCIKPVKGCIAQKLNNNKPPALPIVKKVQCHRQKEEQTIGCYRDCCTDEPTPAPSTQCSCPNTCPCAFSSGTTTTPNTYLESDVNNLYKLEVTFVNYQGTNAVPNTRTGINVFDNNSNSIVNTDTSRFGCAEIKNDVEGPVFNNLSQEQFNICKNLAKSTARNGGLI